MGNKIPTPEEYLKKTGVKKIPTPEEYLKKKDPSEVSGIDSELQEGTGASTQSGEPTLLQMAESGQLKPQEVDVKDVVEAKKIDPVKITSDIPDYKFDPERMESVMVASETKREKDLERYKAYIEDGRASVDLMESKANYDLEEIRKELKSMPLLNLDEGLAKREFELISAEKDKLLELDRIQSSKDLIKKAERYMDTRDAGVLKSMFKSKLAKDYFTLGLTEMARNFDVVKIAEKSQTEELNESEKMALFAYGLNQEISSNPSSEKTIESIVGSGIADVIPFVLQFALTGPTAAGTKETAKKAIKEALDGVTTKQANKYISTAIGELSGRAVQTTMMPEFYRQIPERMIGGITPVEGEGELTGVRQKGTEKGIAEATARSFANTLIEVSTEGFGEYVPKVMKDLGLRYGVNEMSDLMTNQTMKDLRKAAAYNGIITEFGEEVAAAYLQAPVEEQKLKDVWDNKQMAATFLTIAATGGGFHGMDYVLNKFDGSRNSAIADLREAETKVPQDKQVKIDAILKSNDVKDKSEKLDSFIKSEVASGADEAVIKEELNYIAQKTRVDEMNNVIQETSTEIKATEPQKPKVEQKVAETEKVSVTSPKSQIEVSKEEILGKRLEERNKLLTLQEKEYGKLDKENKGGDNIVELGGSELRGENVSKGFREQPRYDVRGSGRVVGNSSIKEHSLTNEEAVGLKFGNPNNVIDNSFSEISDSKLFHKSISDSKKDNKYAASVFVYPESEYKTSKKFITKDGLAGAAIDKNGTIISVFSHGEGKGRAAQVVFKAIKEGGNKLDHYDTKLSQYYYDFGFIPVARVKWNDKYAPDDWDKEKFKRWNNGEPDVVLMVYNGGDVNSLHKRYGRFGKIDLTNTPYFNTFEEAQKYQDEILAKIKPLPAVSSKPQKTTPLVTSKGNVQKTVKTEQTEVKFKKEKTQEGTNEFLVSQNPYLRYEKDERTGEVFHGITKDQWNDDKYLGEQLKDVKQERKELKADGIDVSQEDEAIQLIDTRIKEIKNAIQEQTTDEGVLRQEGSEMELQEVGKGNEKLKEPTEEGKVEISVKLDEEIKKTRKEKLSEKEEATKQRLNDALARLSGAKFAEGTKSVDVAKDIATAVTAFAELGIIKAEQGVDASVEFAVAKLKEFFPDKNIDIYKDDIKNVLASKLQEEGKISGIKKSLIPETAIELTDVEKRDISSVMEEGMSMIESGRILPSVLVQELIKKPRPITAGETAVLIYYKRDLDSKFDNLYDKKEQLYKEENFEEASEYKTAIDLILAEQELFYEAALNSGYEQGLSFRMRQVLLDNEYNIIKQIRKYRAINGGYISPEVEKRFREYDDEIKRLNKEIRKNEKENGVSDANDVLEQISESIKNEKKTGKSGRKRGWDLVSEGSEEFLQAIGGILMATGDKKQDVSKALYKIGLGLMDEGVATLENVIAKIKEKVESLMNGKKFNIDDYKEDLTELLSEDLSVTINEDGKIYIPHRLIRNYVANGIKDIDSLVKAIKKDFDVDVDDRTLRDAITKYGRTSELNKEEIEVEIRAMKRVGRLISAIEDVRDKQERPLRSGLQRDKLSDEERRLTRQLKEAIKDLPIREEDLKKSWKSALDAVKSRLKNQIKDLEHQLNTGEKPPKRKGIEYDAEAESLKEKRDDLKAVLKSTEEKSELSDEQKSRIALSNIERVIKDYERRIKENDFSQKGKSKFEQSEQLKEAKLRLNEIRDEYSKMKDVLGITDKQKLQKIKDNLNRRIKDYERRVKENDFSPLRKTKKQELDLEAQKLKVELEKVKHKYNVEFEKVKLENRERVDKWKDHLLDVWNLPKSLMASADLSAPLRQGAVLSFGFPKSGAKSFAEMFKHLSSQKLTEDWMNKLQATDEYVMMRQSGLYLAEESAKLAAKEQEFMSNLAHKIPIVGKYIYKPSERAYTGYLNKLRVDTFMAGVNYFHGLGYNINDFPEVFKAWATFINNATGRANLGVLEKSANVLNAIGFSPRYLASRLYLLNPVMYAKMPKPVRMLALRSMFAYLSVASAVMVLAIGAGLDVEDDPRSSDFGKPKTGGLRADIWAGFQNPLRTLFQVITGKVKSTDTGVITELGSDSFNSKTRLDILKQFFLYKASPGASLTMDLLRGKTAMGEELTLNNTVLDRVLPLYLSDIYSIGKQEGLKKTSVMAVMSLFGVGFQYYESSDVARKGFRRGLSVDEAIDMGKTEKDKFTEQQEEDVKKRYEIYKVYGLDDVEVNMLLTKTISNDDKAAYLIETDLSLDKIKEYRINKVISEDLWKKYKELYKNK